MPAKETFLIEKHCLSFFLLIFSFTLAADIRIAKRPRVSSGSEANRQTTSIGLKTRRAAKKDVQPSFAKDGVSKTGDARRNSGHASSISGVVPRNDCHRTNKEGSH